MELVFANEDKTINEKGWILDYKFLWSIKDKLDPLQDDFMDTDLETIEAVLLIANGEEKLLKQRIVESEKYF